MPSDSTQQRPLAGKVALVTGGTGGLGLRIARQLAQHGAKVYATGRNEENGRRAVADISGAAFVKIDLATVQSARDGAHAFLGLGEERLDILVNNAALLSKAYELSPDGVVDTLGTNHFGHVVLTQALLPLLTKTARAPGADVRIITIGSDSYKWQKKLRLATVEQMNERRGGDSFNAQMQRYSVSKLAQMMWMRELQARLDAEGVDITCTVANPGAIYSEGARSRIDTLPWPLAKLVDGVLYALAASPEDAAVSAIWAATTPERKKIHDAYVSRKGKKAVVDKWAGLTLDEKSRKELWEISERFVAERLAPSAAPGDVAAP
ncbi:NAD(P)-binding protein [Auricularia subglabra TFB-10046 SS5]|uniref:NAD(P)-binding protein n=1 Tax=Auricularia subglabra (strain TFB-10046 / SS5) TaxID=717982 RepID=J0WQM7_AURST|nr:NAD(P)-binding protein [Auricularia subglabra TFB-10046 SS5]